MTSATVGRLEWHVDDHPSLWQKDRKGCIVKNKHRKEDGLMSVISLVVTGYVFMLFFTNTKLINLIG